MLFNSVESLFKDWIENNLEQVLIFLNNPAFNTDSYKLSHKQMEPDGTETIYANLTPRFNKYFKLKYPNSDDKVVNFGLQYFLIKELIDAWSKYFFQQPLEQVMQQLELIFFPYIGMDKSKLSHFEALHKLGYLPLRIKALPEGTVLPLNIPLITIENTHKSFSFLTNYVESVLSLYIHKPITVATIAREFSKLTDYWFDKTVVDHTFKKFTIHDFSLRGHDSVDAARICGAAALLYSNGTDNVPGYVTARTIYGGDDQVAFSVAASEHSVTTLGINFYKDLVLEGEVAGLVEILSQKMFELNLQDEFEQAKGELITIYRLLTERFPTGLLSYVADSYDYWRVITIILPILKDVIMRREGKLVIRPDSGDPVEMVCGLGKVTIIDTNQNKYRGVDPFRVLVKEHSNTGSSLFYLTNQNKYYLVQNLHDEFIIKEVSEEEAKGSIEILSEIFGYTTNDKGYKELPPQIGLIYGDGITYQRSSNIFENLALKAFASSNIVLGVGSYTFAASMSRDDLGIAVKATNAIVNAFEIPIYKDPKTDDGSKKSARGWLKVDYNDNGKITLFTNVTREEAEDGLLQVVFENSKLYNLSTFNKVKSYLT